MSIQHKIPLYYSTQIYGLRIISKTNGILYDTGQEPLQKPLTLGQVTQIICSIMKPKEQMDIYFYRRWSTESKLDKERIYVWQIMKNDWI